MMTKEQALEYGKRVGVKYLVKDDQGGLYGGFQTRECAESCKKEWNQKNKVNPWIDKLPKIYIEEVETC